ncbi:MFS transporter [Nitrospirales bacterium NOB]|nr:MAG: putative MFS family permease [Nitrospira sp. OLB3]MBV6470429.1 putative multidrug-efflux transporter [Nitrospirota bacterium]MCE7965867.1 MFS transporter [Nitrospira sp. NTP2]MDL1888164.1 MFS transporter [Nitrospirales bacterium NOB]MEB2340211.1 MFS transporter [Nitrospirales bacterium]RIK60389.1 MAG: MFS transporter [Nitrospira sp.]
MAETSQPTSEPTVSGWRLLGTKDFGCLWAGQVISQIGDGLNKVALLWFVYELTGSALKMTAIGLLQTIPPLVFGPLIGVYLDCLPKKTVMIVVDILRALMVLLIPLFYTLDMLTLERLYVLVFLISIVSTVFGPALASAVPSIVQRSQLTTANAFLQSTTNIGVLLGPAISGLGIALIGAQNVLYVDAATFFVSALCLLPIHVRDTRKVKGMEALSTPVIQDMMVGFRFVFLQHRVVFALMITAVLYNLAISAFVFLLPVVAKELLQVGPMELGWLWSALGVGMLAASLWLARTPQGTFQDRVGKIGRSLAIGGMAVCALGLIQTPVLFSTFLLIIVIGGTTSLFYPVVWAMLQEVTPEHLLGRVFTTFSTGGMASAMVGMAGFGWAADAIGPAASLIGIGLLLLLTAMVTVHVSRRDLVTSPVVAA